MSFVRLVSGLLASLLLFAAAALWYVEATVRPKSAESQAVLAAARFLHHADFEVGEDSAASRPSDGREQRAEAPGAALAALPFVLLAERSLLTRAARLPEVHEYVAARNRGRLLPPMPDRISIADVQPFLDRVIAALLAAGVATLVLFATALRVGWIAGIVTALLVAAGTSLLTSHSAGLSGAGPGALGLALGIACLERGKRAPVWYARAGLPFAFAWICAPELAPAVLVVFAYVAIVARAATPGYLAWMLPPLIPVVLATWLEHGALVPAGFAPSLGSGHEFGVALAGHWVSPSRGLLVTSPFLLLGLASLGKKGRALAGSTTAVAALAALLVSLWIAADRPTWPGSAFGAHAMLPVAVLLAPALGTAVRLALDRVREGRLLLLGALLVTSAFATLLHAPATFSEKSWEWNHTPRPVTAEPARVWSVDDCQGLAFLLR